MDRVLVDNDEAIRAWNGPLFERFVLFRDTIVGGLAKHGEIAMDRNPPPAGARVLDVGCGFGDTTIELAARVGAGGSALGVDAAERFIEAAREEAAAAGAENVSFEVADVELAEFGERFDYAYSRFGTMFFASPVAALRNVRAALAPGGTLCMVVWRRKLDNDWMHRAELAVKAFVERPEESEEPTCGPGPFSMANADTVCDVLLAAGYERIALERCDLPMLIGRDMDEAVALMMALGPAGEVLRLLGDEAEAQRPRAAAEIAAALAEFERGDGVWAPSSTWVVTAAAPV